MFCFFWKEIVLEVFVPPLVSSLCKTYIQKVKYTNLINTGVDDNKRRKRGK